jgi:hypothetical protein
MGGAKPRVEMLPIVQQQGVARCGEIVKMQGPTLLQITVQRFEIDYVNQ